MNRLNFIQQINIQNVNPEEFAEVLVQIFDPIMVLYDLLDGREYEAIENIPAENTIACFSITYPSNEAAESCYNVFCGINSFGAYQRVFNIRCSLSNNKVIVYITN